MYNANLKQNLFLDVLKVFRRLGSDFSAWPLYPNGSLKSSLPFFVLVQSGDCLSPLITSVKTHKNALQ